MLTAQATEIRYEVADLFAPPPNLSVSDSISEVLFTGTGKYNPALTPYMSQPADSLGRRKFRVVVFLGPGRTGKTVTLIDGWIARNIVHDPGDMLIVQASQDLARYYSKVRIKRMIAASPDVRERMSASRQDDNTYDKVTKAGMVLAFGWPSSAQLSGRDFRYVAITEYDAASDDIEGEGSLADLGGKRTETFLSAGKLLCESSVRREYTDASWKPATPHEAPPATGITGLYNGGTRNWFYWKCPHCREWFPLHPDVHVAFGLPPINELIEILPTVTAAKWAKDHAKLPCQNCGEVIEETERYALNVGGKWVPDGARIVNDEVVGESIDSDTDSYQISCVAAAYQSWKKILQKYASAIKSYIRTGSEADIKSTVNLDQGRAYLPIAATNKRATFDINTVAADDLKKGEIPEGVRFVIGVADTQGRGFVGMHFGFGPGPNGSTDWWVIDRQKLSVSMRVDDSGEPLPMDPAVFAEDWQRLNGSIAQREFPLSDGSGRRMLVQCAGVDSGGRGAPDGVGGVTEKAYGWWRGLPQMLKRMVWLIKGATARNADRAKVHIPDTQKSGGASSGDVPVLFLNTHDIKDGVSGDLERATLTRNGAHLPRWMDAATFAEFTAEKRTPSGWIKPEGVRNEALDLITYAKGICTQLGVDAPGFWNNPPAWARPWNQNSLVVATAAQLKPQPPRVQSRGTRSTASAF